MYREVTMLEVTEVLRLWLGGTPKKRIAAQLGLDPKTIRYYVAMATRTGLELGTALTGEAVRDVLLALHPSGGRPRTNQKETDHLLPSRGRTNGCTRVPA
jgi:hypothetical protein